MKTKKTKPMKCRDLQEFGRRVGKKIIEAADAGRIKSVGQDAGGGWNGTSVQFRVGIE